MRRVLAASSLVLACALGAACVGDGEQAPLGSASSPVINGVFDDGTKNDATVLLQILIDPTTGMGAGCTGTLISKDVLVTARHCVSSFDERTRVVGADYVASNIYVWLGNTPRGREYAKGKKIVHVGGTTLENADIALLILDTAIGEKVYAPVRLGAAPKTGETVSVAGYGLINPDPLSTTELHKRYRRESLRIQAVGPMPSAGLGAKEIILGESICQGDSGGPVFAGTGALLAVTSRGGNGSSPSKTQPWLSCVDGTYKAMNIFTRVDSFKDLITSTLASLGEVPWEEGTTKPTSTTPPPPVRGALGASCTGPTDCDSGVCIEWGGAKVCSAKCSASAPCPTGYDCNSGLCVAADPVTPPPDDAGPPTDPPAADPGVEQKANHCAVSDVGGSGSGVGAILLAAAAALVAGRRRKAR